MQSFKPDVLGFMMTTYMFPDTLEWIRYLKNNLKPAPFVLIGGYNVRVYPTESLLHPEIDFGCIEHAYYTVPALLQELEKDMPDFTQVPGLAFKKDAEIVLTPHPQKIDFDAYPFPARHLLPNDLYAEFTTQRKNFTVMVTSLGCPYHCLFCEAGGTNYGPRSPQTIIREIEECYTKHAVREIDFFDYDFTAMPSRIREICSLIKEKKFDISWACRSRIDTVDEALLKEMRSAGCERIYFGIESGCQKILDTIAKGITREQIEKTIKTCKKIGIKTLGFFLIGAPCETKETVRETLDFAIGLDLDFVQFSKCLAKPLTPLWKDTVKETGRDYWKEWILGRETDHALPRTWTELSNDEIDALARQAYIRFHARPWFLIRSTFNCRSLSEFFRKFSAFIQMVFSQGSVSKKISHFKAYPANIFKIIRHKHKILHK